MAPRPRGNTLGACTAGDSLEIAPERNRSVLRDGDWRRGADSCTMPSVPKTKPARCEDCFFHQNMLCALDLGKPCPTFRPAERGLAPERQLAFVFRTERVTTAYAFPQPNA
jgi:hypothetical protein